MYDSDHAVEPATRARSPSDRVLEIDTLELVSIEPAQVGAQAFTCEFRRGQVGVKVFQGVIQDAGVNQPGAFR